MSEIEELKRQVDEATGPNWKLEHDLDWHFSEWKNLGGWRRQHKITGIIESFTFTPAPAYTASIDAALSLVEKVLPGCEYELTTLYGVATATLPLNFTDHPYEVGRREDGNMPLAILSALLKAVCTQSVVASN